MSSFADDDDGIIDLHALSKPRPYTSGPASSVFASEPPPAFVSDATPKPANGNTGVIIAAIAGAVFVLALAGVGLRYALRTPAPVARTGVTVASPPPPATTEAAVASAPAAAPASDPAPPSTASDDDGKPAPKKKKGFHGVRRSFAASDVKKEPVTRPARAADPCGCKGNFDCNLRCAAQK